MFDENKFSTISLYNVRVTYGCHWFGHPSVDFETALFQHNPLFLPLSHFFELFFDALDFFANKISSPGTGRSSNGHFLQLLNSKEKLNSSNEEKFRICEHS